MYYDYIGFIVAIIVAIGGAIGYYKAGNVHFDLNSFI